MKKQAFLSQVAVEHPCPATIYSLDSYCSIRALRIDGYVMHINVPSLIKERPTRKAVAELREIVYAFNPSESDVSLSWTCTTEGFGTVSGWLKLHDFLNSGRYALTKEELLPKQQELIAKYAPREGYKACDYCSTQRPVADLKPRKIIARQYPGGYKIGNYCAGEACGGYDQMAHEG
jgi:hypothetical protein